MDYLEWLYPKMKAKSRGETWHSTIDRQTLLALMSSLVRNLLEELKNASESWRKVSIIVLAIGFLVGFILKGDFPVMPIRLCFQESHQTSKFLILFRAVGISHVSCFVFKNGH